MRPKPNFHWTVKYYEYFLGVGIFFTILSVFIYNYKYIVSHDAIIGLIASCSLFLGIVLLGQGLRALKEIRKYKDQFVNIKNRKGLDVTMRKRKPKWSH